MFSKSLTKHFKGFGSRFIELHEKLDADALLYFLSIADKTTTKSKKHLSKNNVCSQHSVTWQTDAFGNVTLVSLSSFSSRQLEP
jgi:hypothetical protein